MSMISQMKKKEINEETIVQRDPDQEFSMIDEEVVMLSLKNGAYYALDPVGSRIWEMIKEPVEVRILIQELMIEFEVQEEVCKKDTFEYLETLNKKDLLK